MQKSDDIAIALLERASTIAVAYGVDTLPVAMPDVPPPWGEAPAPDRYFRVSIFDNVPRWQSVGGDTKIGQGILQIEVIWARGIGTIQIRAAAQAVMDHFPAALRLNHGTAAVKIDGQPWHGSAIPQDDRTVMVVSIRWVASAV